MQRIRIKRKLVPRPREDRYPVIPLDPRDPDVVRVKRAMRRAERAAADRPSRAA